MNEICEESIDGFIFMYTDKTCFFISHKSIMENMRRSKEVLVRYLIVYMIES